MNQTKAKTIDELPELPFEKVLSYLSLEDRLKARAVSRGWRKKFDSYPVKSLCYAGDQLAFIKIKRRLVSGAFACIFSTKFDSFFNAFGRSILSNLKRLRLYELDLNDLNANAFHSTLNSFSQLEELSLFSIDGQVIIFELNLPMLTSLHLEGVFGIEVVDVDAPRLNKIKVVQCGAYLDLVIVHGESVECLVADLLKCTEVKNLKNLRRIYTEDLTAIDPTFLSDLGQLKEIHIMKRDEVSNLFEQKQRYGLTDLKIYLWGLLLNGPDDQLTENPSRLIAWIPFCKHLNYSAIERFHPDVANSIVGSCTNLYRCTIDEPVQDIERFLALLNKFPNIDTLEFWGDHPQDLFDRLPEHSAIQSLTIARPPSGLDFLCKLKDLIYLDVNCSMGPELIRKLFKELPTLSYFEFVYNNRRATINVARDSRWTHPEQYWVCCDFNSAKVQDLEAVIQFIFGIAP